MSLETIRRILPEFLIEWILVIVFRQHPRLFLTAEGYLGCGFQHIREGDLVCVLKRLNIPVLLRKQGSDYVHVGVCYVIPWMDGAAAGLVRVGQRKVEAFTFV